MAAVASPWDTLDDDFESECQELTRISEQLRLTACRLQARL
eukprot:CAMPEP_0115125722 /NCGR_PEP_ID=MMETSP0227-20121206/49220_1 /TAXON_ID=89957 /ORGANISM="Polarella glacialis, Strain CCMP 1383" /LENGTH=40 /DNA_ID= /DNA_START= /DNA_END= /DNA_ORIENTATION=